MKIEDIIECLNKHIEYKRKELNINTSGHLILLKTVLPNHLFKAYKDYDYYVWFVKGESKYRFITMHITDNSTQTSSELTVKNIEDDLMKYIFNWIGTESYDEVIKGDYDGSINE